MELLLAAGVPASIKPGRSVRCRTEFLLDGMAAVAGPYADRDEHEKQVLATDGSIDWFSLEHVDGLRFDRDTGCLRSLALHVPEQRTTPDDPRPARWDLLWPAMGKLCLGEVRQFHLPSTGRQRHSEAALICLYSELHGTETEAVRLRVTDELDLIFESGRLAGWILTDPARHLADGSTVLPAAQDDPQLGGALAQFLSLSTYPALESLMDGNPEARAAFERLRESIRPAAGDQPRRAVLRSRIDQLIADWYD